MRAIVLLTATLLLLAPTAAHAKGGAVTAVEICDTGCRPTGPVPGLDRLWPDVLVATGDGTRYVAASRHTPSFRIRLWLEIPHQAGTLDLELPAASPPVEFDYAPGIRAVRSVEPQSKGHWARIGGQALTTLDHLTRGQAPPSGESQRLNMTGPRGHPQQEADETDVGESVAAGAALIAALALGAGMTRRRRRSRTSRTA